MFLVTIDKKLGLFNNLKPAKQWLMDELAGSEPNPDWTGWRWWTRDDNVLCFGIKIAEATIQFVEVIK